MKRVIAICGKSGSGKDTIVKEILKRYPNLFKPIVSYTLVLVERMKKKE